MKPRAEVPPFSLIEHKGLTVRLAEELSRAASDFAHDPRLFLRELFTDENKDLKRRRLIYSGLAFALVAHVVFISVIFIADWIKPKSAVAEEQLVVDSWVPPSTSTLKKPEELEANMPKGNRGEGGGGGGQNDSRPASGGVLPRIAETAPIIKHNAPEKHAPILAVIPNIQGPESTPAPDATIGVPTANMDAPPSPGSGSGDGLGEGKGSGVGSGDGSGSGPGEGGNKGNRGKYGSPDGTGPGIPFNQIPKISKESGFSQFRWLYRPTPVVTPEAQENKVAGTVLLRATFHADGRITDIEVVSPVPYMTDSAVAALMKSRFKPATVNGRPVTITRVPVRIQVHYGGDN